MDRQKKTALGVVLLLLFGGMACCSLTLALGAYGAWLDAKKEPFDPNQPFAFVDAGTEADAPQTRPTNEDGFDPVLRRQFAEEILAALSEAGHEGYQLDDARYGLSALDGGAQISLVNLFDEYEREAPEDRPAFVQRTVAGFFPPEVPATWEDAKANVLVTVRDRLFLELLTLRAREPVTVVHRALADDLLEVVVFDGPDSMQYLNQGNLDDWGRSADEVFLQGRKNLVSRSKKAFTSPAPGVFESDWADNHDVARALLFETLRKLKVKGEPLVFLPQRDHLVVTGSDDAAALEAALEVVEEHLALPRANSGRGWKLTRTGLVPWVPPEGSRAAALRQQAEVNDANEQKKALDEKFEGEGTDIFVGTTLLTEDDEGGQHTYAVWTKGADTLMPRAEFIVFVDLEQPENQRVVAAASWDDVVKKLGKKMKLDPSYWPARYRLNTFPDAKTLEALGLHPYFARNREE